MLGPKAKLTTFISSVPINRLQFLILRKDLIEFLRNYNVSEYQVWNMKVHLGEKTYHDDYQLFHISNSIQDKCINYKKSSFFVGDIKKYGWVGETITISNYQEYQNQKKLLEQQGLWLKSSKLYLDFSGIHQDLIRVADTPLAGSSGYFISEKLKKHIEMKGFTGMEFEEIGTIDDRVKIIR